ncbi:ADP-ribosylarginine hydrolase Tri1 [Aplysia californica]|uniref:ADP-ribosylarginine hydrolase Tri1 n=1 Tax=Aplysia californica TaxID=6500 RepID=A0ABM1W349_APLCA|nr:ADP-ribosylarginine hydrolase Tri1 [Aplysia californica]
MPYLISKQFLGKSGSPSKSQSKMEYDVRDHRGKIKTRPIPKPRKFSPYTVAQREAGRAYDQILGTLYGVVTGDAIGHLTESLSKAQAHKVYGSVCKELELGHKKLLNDTTRRKWQLCDWTDEADMMLLITESLIYNRGQVSTTDLAKRLMDWSERGYPELGDTAGYGLDKYTKAVIAHPQFSEAPKDAANICWRNGPKQAGASNSAVSRTAILGIHYYNAHAKVLQNTTEVCMITHPDPRCAASCVAVTTAISLMLQQKHVKKSGQLDVEEVISESYRYASGCLLGRPVEELKSLKRHMLARSLKELELGDVGNMSFTYKAVGAGFWALKQKNFRTAIQDIVMEGGDADGNGAVAGALLGCKLGFPAVPPSWVEGLRHRGWLDELVNRYLHMMEQGRATAKAESTV